VVCVRQPESSQSSLDTWLVLGVVVLITAAPLLPERLTVVALVPAACATVVAWVRRCRVAAALRLFSVVWFALALVGIRYSQLTLGAGLLAYAWAARRIAWLQGTATWMQRGSLGIDVWLLVIGSSTAAVALGAWYVLVQRDLSDLNSRVSGKDTGRRCWQCWEWHRSPLLLPPVSAEDSKGASGQP
jgi:hypothetical protein